MDKVNTFILPLCLLSVVQIPYDLSCIQYKSFNLVSYTLIKDIGSNMSRAMSLLQFSIKITWFNLVNRYLNLSHLKYIPSQIKQFGLLDWNIVSVVLFFCPLYSIFRWTEQTFDLQTTNLTRQEDKDQLSWLPICLLPFSHHALEFALAYLLQPAYCSPNCSTFSYVPTLQLQQRNHSFVFGNLTIWLGI